MSELYINGQNIKNWKMVDSGLDDDNGEVLCIDLPQHIIMEESKFEKWIGELNQDDADKLHDITRLDTDTFSNKRVRLYVQILGPVTRPQGRS